MNSARRLAGVDRAPSSLENPGINYAPTKVDSASYLPSRREEAPRVPCGPRNRNSAQPGARDRPTSVPSRRDACFPRNARLLTRLWA